MTLKPPADSAEVQAFIPAGYSRLKQKTVSFSLRSQEAP